MASLTLYGSFAVKINGALLSEASDVSWGTETADSPVMTQLGGFTGKTPHGSVTRYSCTLFDPVSASIVSTLQGHQDSRAVVQLEVLQTSTGKVMKCDAFIENVKGSSSVGSNAQITFDGVGPECAFV